VGRANFNKIVEFVDIVQQKILLLEMGDIAKQKILVLEMGDIVKTEDPGARDWWHC